MAAAVVCCAWGQGPEPNARDMFYSAADLVGKKPAKGGGVHRTDNAPNHTHQKGGGLAGTAGGSGTTVGTTVKVASAPLGLRYSVLKRSPFKEYQEVPPETTFHAGDKLRLSLMSNEKGYLYIVQQGSSGTWSPLFPSPEINAGKNLIEAGRKYEIPSGPGEGFILDETAGEEKIFIMLTRQPQPDLEKVVMSLRQAKPGEPKGPQVAQTHPIDDELVRHLREQIQPRDLIFTKVDDDDDKEKAVYVVNAGANAKPDSRVVVDLKLNHQ